MTPDTTNEEENNDSNNLTNIITRIIKTMRQLPDEHYVWRYTDPTRTYYVNEDNYEGNPLELLLRPHTNQTLNHFIDWHEGQLMVTHEIRKTISRFSLDSPYQPMEMESCFIRRSYHMGGDHLQYETTNK